MLNDEKAGKHLAEKRLAYLYTLKSSLIPKVRDWREQYSGKEIENKDIYQSSYKTNTIFSIINAKKAEILA